MHHKPRREARRKVLLRARLRVAGPERDACLLDLSSRGLLATTAEAPERGQYVEIRVCGQSLVGHVEWANGRRFGVTLRERIDVEALIEGRGEAAVRPLPAPRRQSRPAAAPAFGAIRQVGRRLEFGVLAAAGCAAALMAMQAVGGTLSPLQAARDAMGGSTPASAAKTAAAPR